MKMLTASDLRSGDVVYWTADGAWSSDIADAHLMEDEFAEAALGEARKQETTVVNAYLVVMAGKGEPAAREAMRENIRARGPTVRRDLGKQAEGR
jgi:hypothetical protein